MATLAATGCGPIGTILRRNIHALGTRPRPIADSERDPTRRGVGLAATWIGHATVLVQLGDGFVLTDPVFSSTVGQFSPRLVEPGLEVGALPNLDAVVISHAHIDHLDFRSLQAVRAKTPHLAVPRGSMAYIPPLRNVKAHAVRPWHTLEVRAGQAHTSMKPEPQTDAAAPKEAPSLRMTAVPVKHSGYRYGIDAAWIEGGYTGWVFERGDLTVYFGGDTAYDQTLFRQTRARFPSIDLALIPIAPIEPRSSARDNHLDGEEAVQAFLDLGAEHMVPIHFDTFPHGADRIGDAAARLRAAAAAAGIVDQVHTLKIGETWTPPPRAP